MFVHPTQGVELLGNFFTAVYLGHPLTFVLVIRFLPCAFDFIVPCKPYRHTVRHHVLPVYDLFGPVW